MNHQQPLPGMPDLPAIPATPGPAAAAESTPCTSAPHPAATSTTWGVYGARKLWHVARRAGHVKSVDTAVALRMERAGGSAAT